MEKGWERPEHADVSRNQLHALVEVVFPGHVLARAEVIPSGLANTNIRFRLQGISQEFVLRVHTREGSAAAREAALMRYLDSSPGAKVPVPVLRHTCLDVGVVGYPCSVWEFVEGTLLSDLFESLPTEELNEIATACGQVLAGLAERPFPACGSFDAELKIVERYGPPSTFIEQDVYDKLYRGRAGKRMSQALRAEIWRFVKRHAPRLRVVDGQYCLVHGDFKRSNLILRKRRSTWSVAALLDWEFSFAGPCLVDVGNFLRAGTSLPVGFRDAFFEGYRDSGGTLPADWLQLSRLIDLASQMDFLNRPEERPQVFSETIEVVRETLGILA